MLKAIEQETVFTFLCHPINLAIRDESWGGPVDKFMLPVIDMLSELHRERKVWVCTCNQLTDFYWATMKQ
jgi:hypothetical protein